MKIGQFARLVRCADDDGDAYVGMIVHIVGRDLGMVQGVTDEGAEAMTLWSFEEDQLEVVKPAVYTPSFICVCDRFPNGIIVDAKMGARLGGKLLAVGNLMDREYDKSDFPPVDARVLTVARNRYRAEKSTPIGCVLDHGQSDFEKGHIVYTMELPSDQ